MASITSWNRLEPRPLSSDLAPALAARLRDPVWMLTRQWQVGEFSGADAASPAWIHLGAALGPFDSWSPAGGPPRAFSGARPLEGEIEAEPFSPNLAVRTELGQVFEDLLVAQGVPTLVGAFRRDYPIPPVPEAELADDPDADAARFLRVVAGRAVDGAAVYAAAVASLPALPPKPAGLSGTEADAVRAALGALVDWVRAVYGDVGRADAAAWTPPRLEYAAQATASLSGEVATLAVVPARSATLDWYAFDALPSSAAVPGGGGTTPGGSSPGADPTTRIDRSLLPINVRFRGMPNARWWDFEDASIDFGRLTPDRRDLARLLVMEFMLGQGNDWFVAPLQLESGRVCRIDALDVHDVFGGVTHVARADLATTGAATPATERWTMFSISSPGAARSVADFFLLAPSPGSAARVGAPLEDVRFLRDEAADMVWAIEETIEGGAGRPLSGAERGQALDGASPGPEPLPPPDGAPLRYRLQTTVPRNWIPFLPVAIPGGGGQVRLERAAMLRPDPGGGPPQPVSAVGRILRPSSLAADQRYQIFEEEITRAGVRIMRLAVRTRWVDGSTYLWTARRRLAGRGEGSSGLAYDLAEPSASPATRT